MSRSAAKLEQFEEQGYETVLADLEIPESLTAALDGCTGCYLHTTVGCTKDVDENDVALANKLATALSACEQPVHVVFNSAAGELENMGPRKLHQRAVETLFRETYPNIVFTSLRPGLFMEELWKERPDILDGTFTFCVPPDTPITLTAVCDLGYIAGKCFQSTETTKNRKIKIGGDVLTPEQIAEAFSKFQETPCTHSQGTRTAISARLFSQSLWDEIEFFRNTKVAPHIDELKKEFGKVTSFEEFLAKSGWADTSKTYEDLQSVRRG